MDPQYSLALGLARVQFAATVAFHIIFPAISIGLAAFLVYFEWRHLRTGDVRWWRLYRYWLKIFALSFGMGVVSGIPMSFQFGTNWAPFSEATANVVSPLLGYEVLTAFFLEASFLGIMLFGANRVPPRIHFLSSIAVAAGTLLSAFWILSANSWMQTPAGAVWQDGVFVATDWWAAIFNPSFPWRFAHMVTAAYLATALFVAGLSAARLLVSRGRDETAPLSLRAAVLVVAVLAPLQLLIGDLHGLNTERYQPVKVAAMEGHWQTRARAPFVVFSWPDEKAGRNRLAVEIPLLGSLILKHDVDGVVTGLDSVPPADRPPVLPVFFAFRVMVGLGLLMIAFGLWGAVLSRRNRLATDRRFLRAAAAMTPSGLLAIIAGWIVTEVGRQPWTVYGLLRTAESASPNLGVPELILSLIAFATAYSLIFVAFIYFLTKLVLRGPDVPAPPGRREAMPAAGVAPAVAEE